MLTTKMSASCSNAISFLSVNPNVRKLGVAALAKKRNISETSTEKDNPIFPLQFSTKILAQSAVGVFALGFIDAGYSGDWSRIGVISKGTEDLLKAAAFIVVPLCLFLVFSLSKQQQD